MDVGWIGQVLPALAAFGTAVVALARGQRRLRTNIRHDAETLKELSDGTDAHRSLMQHIEWQIERLHDIERHGKRNLGTAAWGGFLAVGSGYLTFWLLTQDAWWRWIGIPTAVLTIVFLYVLFDAAAVARRDAKGNRIKEGQSGGPVPLPIS